METFNCTKFQADISFSLAIFFLGMSGAVFGSIAEKNPKLMYILSTITFILGLVVSGLACLTGYIELLWIGFGILLGTGCGTSYVANPKSLSVWFRHNKGKGTSIAILSFGFAKVFGTMIIQFLLAHFSLFGTLMIMSGIYFVPMMISTLLFKKIPFKLNDKVNTERIWNIVKTKKYMAIWFMFCANITCGLAFIANEAPMLRTFGFGMVAIGLISSLSSVFNSLGRFGFAALSDWKGREYAYYVVFGISILACLMNLSYAPVVFVIALMMVNMGYGGRIFRITFFNNKTLWNYKDKYDSWINTEWLGYGWNLRPTIGKHIKLSNIVMGFGWHLWNEFYCCQNICKARYT